MKRKIFSLILCMAMIASVFAGTVSTVSAEHEHSYSYTVKTKYTDGDTLEASCTVDGCGNTDTVTIVAPADLTYDGSAKAASLVGADDEAKTEFAGGGLPTITYARNVSENWQTITTVPTEVGKYMASITIDGTGGEKKVASVVYEITKSTITITANSKTKIYDGKPLEDNGYTYAGTLLDGDKLTATVQGSITDVGVATNKVTSYQIMRGEKDVRDEYTVKCESGVLQVTAPASQDARVDTGSLTQVLNQFEEKTEYKEKQLAVKFKTDDNVLAEDKAKIKTELAELGLSDNKTAYVNAELWLGVDGYDKNIGDENVVPVKVIYDFDLTNKADISVFRLHEDSSGTKTFGEITETPNELGEYVEYNKKAGTVTVCAAKYSTFVLTYRDTGGTNAGSVDTGDSSHITLFLIMGILALCVAGFALRRREN